MSDFLSHAVDPLYDRQGGQTRAKVMVTIGPAPIAAADIAASRGRRVGLRVVGRNEPEQCNKPLWTFIARR